MIGFWVSLRTWLQHRLRSREQALDDLVDLRIEFRGDGVVDDVHVGTARFAVSCCESIWNSL